MLVTALRLCGEKTAIHRRNPERIVTNPPLLQLTDNYRSHGGIVNCASFIIELISRFWPYSIDALAKEQGLVRGSKPLFIELVTEGNGIEEFFRSDRSVPTLLIALCSKITSFSHQRQILAFWGRSMCLLHISELIKS